MTVQGQVILDMAPHDAVETILKEPRTVTGSREIAAICLTTRFLSLTCGLYVVEFLSMVRNATVAQVSGWMWDADIHRDMPIGDLSINQRARLVATLKPTT